jgi:hypothetical protein
MLNQLDPGTFTGNYQDGSSTTFFPTIGALGSGTMGSTPSKAGGGLYNYDAATNQYSVKPTDSGPSPHDRLKTFMDSQKSQQSPTSALPNFNQEQMQQFFSALGSMFGGGQTGQPGLNQVAGTTPAAPTMVDGDKSRFANDPFKVTQNALR